MMPFFLFIVACLGLYPVAKSTLNPDDLGKKEFPANKRLNTDASRPSVLHPDTPRPKKPKNQK